MTDREFKKFDLVTVQFKGEDSLGYQLFNYFLGYVQDNQNGVYDIKLIQNTTNSQILVDINTPDNDISILSVEEYLRLFDLAKVDFQHIQDRTILKTIDYIHRTSHDNNTILDKVNDLKIFKEIDIDLFALRDLICSYKNLADCVKITGDSYVESYFKRMDVVINRMYKYGSLTLNNLTNNFFIQKTRKNDTNNNYNYSIISNIKHI